MNNSTAEKKRRILIVDDNRAIHDDFRKILSPGTAAAAALDATETALFGKLVDGVRKIQYEIDSAYQGQDGMMMVQRALAEGRPYALAFVDIRMPPGWDGVETTQKIWAVDPDIQIVLCTAYADYSWDEMFEKLGAADGLVILKKPFDTVEALQLAHALTEKWRLQQQSRKKMEDLERMVAARTGELRQSNQVLQRQRSELQVLFDLMPAMVMFKDAAGVFLRVNQRFADIIGKPVAEIEGRSTRELFPHEAARFDAADLAVMRSGMPKLGIIEQVRNPSGDEHWLETDKVPVSDADGKMTSLIIMAQDITERIRAENVLLESKRFLRSTLDALTAHIAILNEHGTIIEVNAAWHRFAGENGFRGDLHGMGASYLKVCDAVFGSCSEEASAVAAGIRAVMAGQRGEFNLEYPCHSPTEQRWFIVRATRFGGDGPVRVVVAHENITERKLAEESLRLLSSAVEQAKESILITDAQLDLPGPKILFVNPAFTAMTGYAAAEVIGKTPRMFQGPRTDRAVLRRLRQNLEQGENFAGEAINYHKDGKEFDLEWQVAPIRNAGGKITHFVAVERDITARKKLAAQLFQSQKLETVGKLAGGVAHEFNSILTAIIGQSELMLQDLPAGSPLTENTREIIHAATRAATLTRQLLAYGRKQFLQPQALDLNRVLAGMGDVLGHLMGGEMVKVNWVPSPGLRLVKADAGQIEQVIMNLAMNARDAMPNGGQLTLETANVTFDAESVGRFPELKPGDYVLLAVSDTGAGMSEAVKARAFEPFFSTKGVGQGTGLGLSTCYGIIKQSGGHISLYSELGRGTTCKIYLPQVEPAAKLPPARLDTPDLPRGTETILLVEDDPALREMAATLLQRLGYEVRTAANGVEALSLHHAAGTGRIDLLFTDLVMPHMSGSELADRVRALYPQTKILFTSAYTEQSIIHQGVLDQGVALLQKPFTPSALAHKLREVLDGTGVP